MIDLKEVGILWKRYIGVNLLWFRNTGEHSAQVHDGTNILGEMSGHFAGKRGQNFVVRTYKPWEGATRGMLTETYHGTRAAAVAKMERLVIAQYRERNGL